MDFESMTKQAIHEWIRRGIKSLEMGNSSFLRDLENYVSAVHSASHLAMNREQAEFVLRFLNERRLQSIFPSIHNMMEKRIETCERQGEYSLEQKKKIQAMRAGEIFPAPEEFSEEEVKADPVLRYFHYIHLPVTLQAMSKQFYLLARHMVDNAPRNAERSAGLRKLLEAKDCAVRSLV